MAVRGPWTPPKGRQGPIPTASLMVTGGQPMLPLDDAPFTVDPQKAAMGGKMFAALGCAACHQMEGVQPLRPAKALAALDAESPQGCLGTSIAKGIPNDDWSDQQRAALKAAVKNAPHLAEPLDAKTQVTRMMAAFN